MSKYVCHLNKSVEKYIQMYNINVSILIRLAHILNIYITIKKCNLHLGVNKIITKNVLVLRWQVNESKHFLL